MRWHGASSFPSGHARIQSESNLTPPNHPVSTPCTQQAHRKAALKHHPDKGGDEEKFKEVRCLLC